MFKIMFVCHGNICRSPMAEFVFKEMVRRAGEENEFIIASAATSSEEIGNDIHRGTKKKLTEMGVPFEHRSAKQLRLADYDQWDLFLGMDSMNTRNMYQIFGDDKEYKIKLLLDFTYKTRDIADPWYTGNFDVTYNDVVEGCKALLNALTLELGTP